MRIPRPMTTRLIRRTASTATLLVLAGCGGGSTEPGDSLHGTYDLSLLSGQTLPAIYHYYGFTGATKTVVGGTLELSRDLVTDSRRLRLHPTGTGGLWSDFEYNTTASSHLDGDLVIIQRPRVPGQATAYADTGLFDGDILHVPVKTIDGELLQVHTLTYVKR